MKAEIGEGFRGVLRGFRCGMWILGIDLQVTQEPMAILSMMLLRG